MLVGIVQAFYSIVRMGLIEKTSLEYRFGVGRLHEGFGHMGSRDHVA